MDENLKETLISLAEGRLTPETWLSWFDEHQELVERTCGRTTFLKMKTSQNASALRNTYAAQGAACNWLKTLGITIVQNDIYQKAWEKEFEDFCKQEKQKQKALQQQLEADFGELKPLYPKFYKQLLKTFDTSDEIIKGHTEARLTAKEQELSVKFSNDLSACFQLISRLSLEGMIIDFDQLSQEILNDKTYLVLGEFWSHGDGDLLLYDPLTGNIAVYGHEYGPPKIIKLADTMTAFLEGPAVKHLKAYAD